MRVVYSSSVQVSMPKQQKKQSKEIVPKVPRGLRSLPVVSPSSDSRGDYNVLKADAAQIEEWWSSPRWRLTKRVYSGKWRRQTLRLAWKFACNSTVRFLAIVRV